MEVWNGRLSAAASMLKTLRNAEHRNPPPPLFKETKPLLVRINGLADMVRNAQQHQHLSTYGDGKKKRNLPTRRAQAERDASLREKKTRSICRYSRETSLWREDREHCYLSNSETSEQRADGRGDGGSGPAGAGTRWRHGRNGRWDNGAEKH